MYKYTCGMYIYTLERGMYIYTFLMYKYTSYIRENVFVRKIQKSCEKNCVIVHFAEKPAFSPIGGRRKNIHFFCIFIHRGEKKKDPKPIFQSALGFGFHLENSNRISKRGLSRKNWRTPRARMISSSLTISPVVGL